MLLFMLDIFDVDWLEACDEIVFIVLYEYIFFGFLALPTMKILLQTYDCKENEHGQRVLRRSEDTGKDT